MFGTEEIKEQLFAAAESYAFWWQREFSVSHDPSKIHGETNDFRYRPRSWHLLRIQQKDDEDAKTAAALTALACLTVETKLAISLEAKPAWLDQFCEITGADARIESDQQLAQHLTKHKGGSLRIIGPYEAHDYAPSVIGNNPIVCPRVFCNGRLELLNYLREQSVTETVHRYGNII